MVDYNKPLSPSSINKYLGCGYNFYLDKFGEFSLESGGDAANFGKAVHTVAEKFWPEYLVSSNPTKALQQSIDNNWKAYETGIEYDTVAKDCFDNFLTTVIETPQLLPLYTELRCENTINNTVAIIDVVYPHKILDYKTSSYYTKNPKEDNIIQATMCSMNLKECFGLDIRRVEFNFLRFNKYQYVDVTDKMIDDMNLLIIDIRNKIKNGEFPKNKKSCFICNYKLVCEMETKLINKRITKKYF